MLDNGSVKCWGKNNLGQLGLGNTSNRGDNSSYMGDNLPVVDLGTGRTAKAIAAGGNHTCAILLDNASIKCWGYNASGQLGLGDTNNRGDGSNPMGDSLPSVDLGSGRTAKAIAAGGNHTCAILDNSAVMCWGKNDVGQLGLGNTTDSLSASAVNMGSGITVKSIAAGGNHTCAILDNSSAVMCWGKNDQGQLGLGNTTDSPNPSAVNMGSGITAKAIVAGESHTCAILNNSAIKCWGRAYEGQMGLSKYDNDIGDQAGEMGVTANDLTNIGTGRTATAIAAGKYHNCAILDNASIKCWGANASGQLGLGDTNNRGADYEEGTYQMGDNLPSVDLGTGRTARGIIAGDNQTCAILDNASIKCWGSNISGELGIGETENRGDNSSDMGDALPVISL
jgi:alpha-tubulin suppressor-like RCC1 family protein